MAKIKELEKKVLQIALPIAQQLNLEIWDIQFVKEGSEYYLRIAIDKPEGISIDDCKDFSHAIDPLLDEYDPIDTTYYLEVSSPGLGRQLTRPEHFEKMLGEEIKVGLYQAINGQKEFTGKLVSYGDNLVIKTEDEELTFEKKQISVVKLNDDADLF